MVCNQIYHTDCSPSEAFCEMLRLASAGARGDIFDGTVEHWKSVCFLAAEHSVLPLVGCALQKNHLLQCPPDIKNYILEEKQVQSLMNVLRRQFIMSLLQEMEQRGICPQILKGYAMADCYAYPECRTAADTDILIPPKQEHAVRDFLRSKGFAVDKRSSVSHHTVCSHDMYGVVEVHVALYDDIVEDVWFRGKTRKLIQEPPLRVESSNGTYTTLGYTDHLIFLILHAMKHFISSGLSVSMLLDIAMYWRKKQGKIDTQRLWSLLRELRYETALSCMLHALIRYGGFEADIFPSLQDVQDSQIERLLADIETGGRMGFKNAADRQESAYEYARLVMLKEKSKWQYYGYMLLWNVKRSASALFPSKDHLIKRYPYLKSKPWLLPWAWLHRLLFRGIKALKKDQANKQIRTNSDSLSGKAQERVEMFEMLGMI